MATATALDKKGMKRICPSCSTRYYDFNKRPVICPNCKTEFTGEIKVRARRTRSVANDIEESQASPDTAADNAVMGDDEDVLLEEGEEGVVSLEDLDEEEDEKLDEDEAGPDLELDEEDDDIDDEDDDDLDDEDDDEEEEDEDDTPKRKKKR